MYTLLALHPITDGNDYVKIVERDRLIRISNTQKMRVYFFLHFSICKHIIYMFTYSLCITVKKHSHLICT